VSAAAEGKALFYPVWVSNSGRTSLRWGKPCDTPREAREAGRAEVDAGRATLAFVVKFEGGEKAPMPGFTYPNAAMRIIEHWEALHDATE